MDQQGGEMVGLATLAGQREGRRLCWLHRSNR